MNRIPIEPGRVVISKAGRDQGRAMVVLSLDGQEHALLADGRLRTVDKPKRKKFKHLAAKPVCIVGIVGKLSSDAAHLNAEIRAALEQEGFGRPDTPSKEG